MRKLVVIGALALAAPAVWARAQAPEAAEGREAAAREAEDRARLEREIAKELGVAPGPRAGGAAASPPATPGAGGSPYARLLLMPDLSAVGSVVAVMNTHDAGTLSPRAGPVSQEGRPRFLFEELELGVQAVIDPYARADAFLAFTPEGVDLEEAYVTFLALPGGLQLRAGKLFSPFGRQNQQHPHAREFVDPPLAQARLLAEESLGGAGVDAAWLAPVPWFAELHLAAQDTAPAEDDEPRLTGVARLLQYFPLGEVTTLGLGLSAARRSEARSAFRDLGGADVFLRVKPAGSRAYLAAQAEVYARRFRGGATEGAADGAGAGTDTGGWAQVFWRSAGRYGLGARYERAPAAAEGLAGDEQRVGALAAWFPSEFQRLRLQVSYDRLPGGRDGLEALLSLEFGLGAHGAHPF